MAEKSAPALIQVVERAFDILELLAREKTPLRSAEIAARLEISQQSASNLLRTLYQRGYLSQDNAREYCLGAQCVYLGSFADRWRALRAVVSASLEELVALSQCTGFVGVIENDRLLCVALLNPGQGSVQQPPQLWTEELHSTACGRVLLAALSEEERDKLFARITRSKKTAHTTIEPDALHRLCTRVQTGGYAEVHEESRLGTSSLAIPLRNHAGEIVAGLAIAGQRTRWQKIPRKNKLAWLHQVEVQIEVE